MTLATAHSRAAPDDRRITNVSDVRLRSAPSVSASTIGGLPLGIELDVQEQTKTGELWYHVRTDDGQDGWVQGSLTTTPLDPGRRDQTIESIVVSRLQSGGNFAARVQLFELVERTMARLSDSEARARFTLYRLRAMSSVFESIPYGRGAGDPYAGWIRDHQDAATYDELRGQWMVDPWSALEVHERYRGTAAADDIAWFFVVNGLPRECEGDVPCYVSWENQLDGWYLQSYPRGKHADDSNAQIALRLNGAMDNLQNFPAVLREFDPQTRCDELHMSLDPLTAAVTASTSTHKTETLAAIDRFAQLCR